LAKRRLASADFRMHRAERQEVRRNLAERRRQLDDWN
jgi:hypothetical protein